MRRSPDTDKILFTETLQASKLHITHLLEPHANNNYSPTRGEKF